MAVIHQTTIIPSKLELLTAWMPRQRWFAGKGQQPQLSVVGHFRFEDPAGQVGVQTMLVADTAGAAPVVYQVPLTYRSEPLDGADAALVGTTEHGVLGTRYVYDGCHDPVYVAALVALVLREGQSDNDPPGVASTHLATGVSTGRASGHVTSSRVLRGEQSNTSVICELDALGSGAAGGQAGEPGAAPTGGSAGGQLGGIEPMPLIIKVFRTLQAGDNPDVVLQTALTDAGSSSVPTVYGHVEGSWDDPTTGELQHGHLAFAQAFIPGVEDAWRVALVAAQQGRDFSARARDLGVMTAQVHADLARALGTSEATEADRERLRLSMEGRLADAAAVVPGLADRADDVRALLARALEVSWPALQRIHGDYHLGQVLDTPGEGWKALDFEGEPLRPLAERAQPDLTARDIAGMLRSFDYAAGSVALDHQAGAGQDAQAPDAAEWARAARTAFLEGYQFVAGPLSAADEQLVSALELDKALYEAVYEARNRPTWLPIPVAAIDRLLPEGGSR